MNLLKKADQYQKNLERIRNYEKFIIKENNSLGHYSFGGNPIPHSEPAKIASREKSRLETQNRNLVLNLASWLETNSAAELNEAKAYRGSWLKTTQEDPTKPLSLLEALKAIFEQSNSQFKDQTLLYYKLTQLLGEELEQFNATETERNNLRNYLTATQRAVVRTERQRDKYLEELKEQDHDLREQEELLATKNSKLAQTINGENPSKNEANKLRTKLNKVEQKLKRTNQYKSQERNKLQTENNSLKGQLTYYQDQDNKLRDTIQNLQQEINNHVCYQINTHTHTHTQTPLSLTALILITTN